MPPYMLWRNRVEAADTDTVFAVAVAVAAAVRAGFELWRVEEEEEEATVVPIAWPGFGHDNNNSAVAWHPTFRSNRVVIPVEKMVTS